jgi:hypothetical protein
MSGARPEGNNTRTLRRKYEGVSVLREKHAAKMRERNWRTSASRRRATNMWATRSTEERSEIMARVRQARKEAQ